MFLAGYGPAASWQQPVILFHDRLQHWLGMSSDCRNKFKFITLTQDESSNPLTPPSSTRHKNWCIFTFSDSVSTGCWAVWARQGNRSTTSNAIAVQKNIFFIFFNWKKIMSVLCLSKERSVHLDLVIDLGSPCLKKSHRSSFVTVQKHFCSRPPKGESSTGHGAVITSELTVNVTSDFGGYMIAEEACSETAVVNWGYKTGFLVVQAPLADFKRLYKTKWLNAAWSAKMFVPSTEASGCKTN